MLRRLFFALVLIYAVALILFLLIRWRVGEPTPVALVNRFLPLILMPSLVLLPLCLLGRRVRLALLLVPAVWLFGADYGPLFLPNPDPPVDAPRLVLATYNIGARTTLIEPLIDTMRAVDADIIALQEVSQQAATQIETGLAELYPYMALHPHESMFLGYGLLSKYPITDDYAYPTEPDRLRLQRTQVDYEGVPVTLFNFHAQPVTESWRSPDVMVRRRQVWQLLDEADNVSTARILLGDFNLNEQSDEYAAITTGYHDAFYEAGWGMGFTNPVWVDLEQPPASRDLLGMVPPHRRIDFVFYDSHWQAARAETWPQSGGSDHLPLIVELAFTG